MNAPVIEQSPYTASAYNSTDIPTQPPHKWRQDANRSNLRRTQLRWGHYANLQPWQVVDMQLQANEHCFVERTGEAELYCDQQRWRFENFNKLLMLIPFLKITALFVVPWFFWAFATMDLLPKLVLPLSLLSVFTVLMFGVSGWLYWEKI
ncbi:hypothetical protein I0E51_18105 [Pseudomonas lalucatii]|nr:hypothetical protein [Pseudomonas lalucatii]